MQKNSVVYQNGWLNGMFIRMNEYILFLLRSINILPILGRQKYEDHNFSVRAKETVQWVKAFGPKPHDLSLIARSHIV